MGTTEYPTGKLQVTPVAIFKIIFSPVYVPRRFYLDLQQGCVVTGYLHMYLVRSTSARRESLKL